TASASCAVSSSSTVWSFSPGCFCSPAATTEPYPLSLHDALPISGLGSGRAGHQRSGCPARADHCPAADRPGPAVSRRRGAVALRSEEHTSELQSREKLVCRPLLEKKKKKIMRGESSVLNKS